MLDIFSIFFLKIWIWVSLFLTFVIRIDDEVMILATFKLIPTCINIEFKVTGFPTFLLQAIAIKVIHNDG